MKVTDSDLRARFRESFGHVTSLRKQAARLLATAGGDASIAVGATKLGGLPDLPPKVDWPSVGDRPLAFLAQVRLDELAAFDDDALLPRSGLLSFFAEDGGESPGGRTGRVIHTADTDGLLRAKSAPAHEQSVTVYRACGVALANVSSFPQPKSPFVFVEDLPKKEQPAYAQLLVELEAGVAPGKNHRALGYPTDPDEGSVLDGDSRLVLQIDSDPDAGFRFGAGGAAGRLYFIGSDAALRRADFSGVRLFTLRT